MNTNSNYIFRGFSLIAMAVLAFAMDAEVRMPAFFSDNMVLQRDTDVRLWGEAKPNTTVRITAGWNLQDYRTNSGKDGKWSISIPTTHAGGPYTLTVSDGTPLTFNNVMLGEVWLCSGQSNMEMPMKGFKNQPVDGANMAVLESRNPNLRLFTVKRNSSTAPVDDVTGKWSEASPAAVRNFSATAYFFGRRIQDYLDVPVGLVVAAWGGSACEAWMSDDMLKAFPEASANIPPVGGEIKSKNRTPSVLFKGMLNPLIGMSMRGVIWYQGEDNWNRAHSYTDMFSTMIKGWRELWGQGEFPFYYCQIAPYDYSIITEIKGDTVIVSFDRAPEWIAGKHSFESTQFKLAGEDRVFHSAKAWISRSKVMVRSEKVPHPVAVRYAFENASEGDLFSTDGLPVSSFRSDNWPDDRPVKK